MTRKMSLFLVLLVLTASISCQSMDLKPNPINDYIDLCKKTNADAVLVMQNDKIVGEWYSEDWPGALGAMSTTKSISSVVLGVMEYNGLIHPDDKVGKYIPSWNEGLRSEVTIEHLLHHRSGLLKVSLTGKESVGDNKGISKNQFVINLTPDVKPGTQSSYSNEGAQLLSPIMDAASGMSTAAYAMKNLFLPLGLKNSSMHTYGPNNDTWTYADMLTTPRDLAKIGKLMLNEGVVDGKRYLSPEYFKKSTQPFSGRSDWGYMWRIEHYGDTKVITSEGYLNNNMYIVPEENLIIVRMQDTALGYYSGEDESYPYIIYEELFISDIIDYYKTGKIRDVKREIENINNKANSIVDEAGALSGKGETEKVIKMLQAFLKRDDVDNISAFKAHLLLALQYCRMRDFEVFKMHVRKAEKHCKDPGSDFYGNQLKEFQEMVKVGHF